MSGTHRAVTQHQAGWESGLQKASSHKYRRYLVFVCAVCSCFHTTSKIVATRSAKAKRAFHFYLSLYCLPISEFPNAAVVEQLHALFVQYTPASWLRHCMASRRYFPVPLFSGRSVVCVRPVAWSPVHPRPVARQCNADVMPRWPKVRQSRAGNSALTSQTG